ncbi:MFS transporter [Clostridium oryzae]|uniref:2-acyl-glycerophospho-ethanolamine acyltransferase n=1 Tax=Clostridium oryzae TaxID=1450648 RepID=A0A1V4I476_9CLOT|nr:MFS transporter [Clostridium oryzae]OPJ54782.1 2-acyl-glycerophospho-ethanolamine acyltransferase [Clostridium oryzae]
MNGKDIRKNLCDLHFNLFCLGQIFFEFSNILFAVVLTISVYRVTQSGYSISTLMFIKYLPVILLGPIAGVFVDRYKKYKLMTLCLAIFIVILILIHLTINLFEIYIFLFIYMVMFTLYKPARYVCVPVIVQNKKLLIAANSILMCAEEATGIFGSLIVSVYESKNTSSTLFSMLPIVSMCIALPITYMALKKKENDLYKNRNNSEISDDTSKQKIDFGKSIKELVIGWKYFKQNKALFPLAIIVSITWLGIGSFTSIHLIYIVKYLKIHDYYYGYVASILSIGSILGYILCPILVDKLNINKYKIWALGFLIAAFSIVMAIYTNGFYYFVFVLLLFSISTGCANTVEESLEQELPIEEHRGKVISFISTIGTIGFLVGTVGAPFLTDYINIRYILIISAASCFVVSALIRKNYLKRVSDKLFIKN